MAGAPRRSPGRHVLLSLGMGILGLAAPLPPVAQFAHDHRAGTAIAFGTAFFGAGAMQVLAQVLQNGAGVGLACYFVGLAAKVELDGAGGLWHLALLEFGLSTKQTALWRAPGRIVGRASCCWICFQAAPPLGAVAGLWCLPWPDGIQETCRGRQKRKRIVRLRLLRTIVGFPLVTIPKRRPGL